MSRVAVGGKAQQIIEVINISILAVSTILKAKVSGFLVVPEHVL
jgi:hypothetical protein